MDDGLHAPQRLDGLAEVGQAGAQHPGLAIRPGDHGVRGRHVVTVLAQAARNRAARLAARPVTQIRCPMTVLSRCSQPAAQPAAGTALQAMLEAA